MESVDMRDKTATGAAIEALQRHIVAKRLKAGDPLASEKELAGSLGVSRTIIREALRHFRSLGIIESRRKVGIRIRRLMPDNPFEGYIPFIGGGAAQFRKLLEARMTVESGVLSALVVKIDASGLGALDSIVAAMGRSEDSQVDLDAAFHSKLLELMDNELLFSLKPLIVDHFELMRNSADGRLKTTNQAVHARYVDALRRRSEPRVPGGHEGALRGSIPPTHRCAAARRRA